MSLTVPMNCSVNRQVILDKHFQLISYVNVDKGTGLLAIDEIDLTTETVYAYLSFNPRLSKC